CTITRRSLVSHLGNYLIFFSSLRQHSGLIYIMCKRLLHVHMLPELHSRQRYVGMIMIGSCYRNRVKMLRFFLKHLPPVFIIFRFRESLYRGCSPTVIHITKEGYVCFTTTDKAGQITRTFTTHT